MKDGETQWRNCHAAPHFSSQEQWIYGIKCGTELELKSLFFLEKKSGYQWTFSWILYLLDHYFTSLSSKIVIYLNSILVAWEPGEILESQYRFYGFDEMSGIRQYFFNLKIVIKPFVNSESQEAELKETPKAISPNWSQSISHAPHLRLSRLTQALLGSETSLESNYKAFFKLDSIGTFISLF